MKANRNIITNKKGQANIIILAIFTVIMGFGMLTIGTYLYYAIASSADAGTQIAVRGTAASGSFAFNGSNFTSDASTLGVTNVTITDGGIFIFEFNTTTLGTHTCKVANCILVNVTNANSSLGGATALVTAINANASAAALVTASLSGNSTNVVYDSRSTAGNSVVLSDDTYTSGQQAWIVSSGLSGGINDVTGQASQNSLNNYVAVTFPLFGLALMILGFGVIFITLKKSFGGGERQQ